MHPGITLYVLRHGQTDWNATGRYQGQTDTELNEMGRDQARRNGRALLEACPDPAALDYVASPLKRTRQTMEELRAAMGLDPLSYRTDERLREIHYGHWEGLLARELPELDPQGLAARQADPINWRPLGGETYVELKARTDDWLAAITRDTLVVTHGGPSRTLRGSILGLDPLTVPGLPVPQDRVLVLTATAMHWI